MNTTAFRRLILGAVFSTVLMGCASPGEPVERKAAVPEAVSDLAASQMGNDVVLTFAVPKRGLNRLALKQTPSLDIYRGLEIAASSAQAQPSAGAASTPANLLLLASIPSAMVSRYAQNGQIRYADSLEPSDFRALANHRVVYAVRAFVVQGKSSANSNFAALQIVAPPMPIEDLFGEATHAGIALRWTAPTTDMSGQSVALSGYRIYRRQTQGPSEGAPSLPLEPNKAQALFARIAEVAPGVTSYADTGASTGTTYAYSVRPMLDRSGQLSESPDSNIVTVADKDVFPPAATQNVVLAPVPGQGNMPAHVEISWQISPEPDVVGYNVYRSEDASVPGERQNIELLPIPAFRDMKVTSGHRYFYSVTAVDRSGNESAPSTAVQADVPASNP